MHQGSTLWQALPVWDHLESRLVDVAADQTLYPASGGRDHEQPAAVLLEAVAVMKGMTDIGRQDIHFKLRINQGRSENYCE